MRSKKIVLVAIATIVSIMLLSFTTFADYTKGGNNLRYAVGDTQTTITVGGLSNNDYYSYGFSGGGAVADADYLPNVNIFEPSNGAYSIDQTQINSGLKFEDGDYKVGYASIGQEFEFLKEAHNIQVKTSQRIEGKYSNLMNGYPTLDYCTFEEFYPENIDFFDYDCIINGTLTFINTDGAKISYQATYQDKGSNNFYSTSPIIARFIDLLYDDIARGTDTPAQNQRATLYYEVKTTLKPYDDYRFVPGEGVIVIEVYPTTNDISKYTPSPTTLPYNVVENTIDLNQDATKWLGSAIQSFWDFELIPNITMGNILIVVLSIAITIGFLKYFAGG